MYILYVYMYIHIHIYIYTHTHIPHAAVLMEDLGILPLAASCRRKICSPGQETICLFQNFSGDAAG